MKNMEVVVYYLQQIASYITLKYPLLKSCFKGKRYVEKVLSSNKTLLGYHG